MQVDKRAAVHKAAIQRRQQRVFHRLPQRGRRDTRTLGGDSHLQVDKLIAVTDQVDKAIGAAIDGIRVGVKIVNHLAERREVVHHRIGTVVGVEPIVVAR